MINYLWRLLGTAVAFTLFGLGALVLSVLVFPCFNLLVTDIVVKKRRSRRLIAKSFRLFILALETIGVIRFRLDDLESLTNLPGQILVANHPSLIDVVLLIARLDDADCIVKASLYNNPFLSGAVKAAGYIPNSDPEQLLIACQQTLNSGSTLIIFPEGTRSIPNQPLKLQRGAANIALRITAKIRLVHIKVHPSTLTKSEPWYQIPRTKPTFHIKLGEQIDTEIFAKQYQHTSLAARRLTGYISEQLSKDIF